MVANLYSLQRILGHTDQATTTAVTPLICSTFTETLIAKECLMKRKQYSTEEIIRILRQVDEEQTGRRGMPRSQHLQSHLSPLETQIR